MWKSNRSPFPVQTIEINNESKKEQYESIEETLAWVRKSSALRRKKYRNQYKHTNDKSDVRGNNDNIGIPSTSESHEQVSKHLERGQSVLALAEAHMRHFEECFKHTSTPSENILTEKVESCLNEFINPDDEERRRTHQVPQNELRQNNKHQETEQAGTLELKPSFDIAYDRLKNKLNNAASVAFDEGKHSKRKKSQIDQKDSQKVNDQQQNDTSVNIGMDDKFDDDNSDVEEAIKFMQTVNVRNKERKPKPISHYNDIDTIINGIESLSGKENSDTNIDRAVIHKLSTNVNIYEKEEILHRPLKRKQKKITGTKIQFDPNQLQATRRAAVNAAKWEENIAVAEACALAKSVFKARPLPGGVWVKNDPYKPTQAALGKHVSKEEKNCDESNIEFGCIDSPINRTNVKISHPEELQQITHGGMMFNVEDQIYVNKLFFMYMEREKKLFSDLDGKNHSDVDSMNDDNDINLTKKEKERIDKDIIDIEDNFNALQREVEKLGLRLEHRKKYLKSLQKENEKDQELCLEDIANLYDIYCLKCNDSVTNMKSDSMMKVSPLDTSIQSPESWCHENIVSCKSVYFSEPNNDHVYRRQEKWLINVEKKREDARAKKEKMLLENFTGKPEITNAKESWEKAKAAHAELIWRAREETNRLKQKKEAHDRKIHAQRMTEINAIHAQANKRKKLLKANSADIEKQKEASKKLYQPRKAANNTATQPVQIPNCLVTEKYKESTKMTSTEDSAEETTKDLKSTPPVHVNREQISNTTKNDKKVKNEYTSQCTVNIDDSEGDRACEDDAAIMSKSPILPALSPVISSVPISFDDMNDKDFARMMRKLGIDTKNVNIPKSDKNCTRSPQKNKKLSKMSTSDLTERVNAIKNLQVSEKVNVNENTEIDSEQTSYKEDDRNLSWNMKKDIQEKISSFNDKCSDNPKENQHSNINTNLIECSLGPDENKAIEDTNANSNGYYFTSKAEAMMKTVEEKLSNKSKQATLIVASRESSLESGTSSDTTKHGTNDTFASMYGNDYFSGENDNLEPYERYEAGKTRFFDPSSSADKGRFRVRDAKGFAPGSMRRKPHIYNVNTDDENENNQGEKEFSVKNDGEGGSGVTLLVGKKEADAECFKEKVITILFDKSKFTEASARKWWREHRSIFVK